MSEYQYYRFERIDGYIDSNQHQALRDISSRADITATSFQVYYQYSSLKAEPYEMMLNYFDIGFYYANWGSTYAYIKLPVGTIPDALLEFETHGLEVHQTEEWQLLIFFTETSSEYFDYEYAEGFCQHLAGLRKELMQGDWRLLYFMWLKELNVNDELDAIPLIEFDFNHLSDGQRNFATLYDIPPILVKALTLTLAAKPSHQAKQTQFQIDAWLNSLTEIDKDNLLKAVFEQGQLTHYQALAMTQKKSANKEEAYQHWLTPDVIAPYIEQANIELQQEQAEALAKKAASEKAEKEEMLIGIYRHREHYWQQAQEQADRTCARGYDNASLYLHQLFEAHQIKSDALTFEERFKRFIAINNSRKALLNRLQDLR